MVDPSLLSHMGLWVLVLFQGLVLLGVVRVLHQSGTSQDHWKTQTSTYEGHSAPSFSAPDISGNMISSSEYSDRPRAFVFVSSECPTCALTLAEMEHLQWKTNGDIIVVCRSRADDCRRLAETYGFEGPVLLERDLELSKLFGVPFVPSAVLVDANNRIASHGRPLRGEEIEGLFGNLESAAEEPVR